MFGITVDQTETPSEPSPWYRAYDRSWNLPVYLPPRSMSSSESMARGDPMLAYAKQYDALKAELQTLGFLCQGSLQTRRVACGKTTCRCHRDPDARHGPYHYWTRKARGKTVGMHLTEDEVVLYQEWIENNRELERIVTEMRDISSRVLALITGREVP